MHIEILVEDASGAIALQALMPGVLACEGQTHSFRIHPYKGIGRIPPGLTPGSDARKRILLDQLPRLLNGYGRSLRGQDSAVVVVVDLDLRVCKDLKEEMLEVLRACESKPVALFRIAIEEIEAWMLGDRQAVEQAYPKARRKVLDSYVQDSVCGTWELLADAVHQGGSRSLKKQGWPRLGQLKCEWAQRIAPLMDVERNASRSFQVFRDGVRGLLKGNLPPSH